MRFPPPQPVKSERVDTEPLPRFSVPTLYFFSQLRWMSSRKKSSSMPILGHSRTAKRNPVQGRRNNKLECGLSEQNNSAICSSVHPAQSLGKERERMPAFEQLQESFGRLFSWTMALLDDFSSTVGSSVLLWLL